MEESGLPLWLLDCYLQVPHAAGGGVCARPRGYLLLVCLVVCALSWYEETVQTSLVCPILRRPFTHVDFVAKRHVSWRFQHPFFAPKQKKFHFFGQLHVYFHRGIQQPRLFFLGTAVPKN